MKMLTDPRYGPENLKRLTELHKQRYSSRMKAGLEGNPAVRVDECKHLLGLWENVEDSDYDWDKLGQAERNEVMDAVLDEEE
jgi:hypothetical protein